MFSPWSNLAKIILKIKKKKALKKNKKKRGGNRERYKVIEVPRNGESGEKKVMLWLHDFFRFFRVSFEADHIKSQTHTDFQRWL